MESADKKTLIIEKLNNEYQKYGFITEDAVFDTISEHGLPLDEIDRVCEVLLMKGIIIRNDSIDEDDDEFTDRSQIDYDLLFQKIIKVEPRLTKFIDEVRQIKPPQMREQQNLIAQAKNGNEYARERLITMYMRVAAKLAYHHHKKYALSLEDTLQDALMGLVVAFDKFEIGRQDNFSTYAPWWMQQTVNRNADIVRSHLRAPEHAKVPLFAVIKALSDAGIDEVDPNNKEQIEIVCKSLECIESEAESHLALLQIPVYYDACDDFDIMFSDKGEPIDELDFCICHKELEARVKEILNTLTGREEKVISLRFGLYGGEPMTLEEVGQEFGVTRERIRQIEAKAIRKLQHPTRSKRVKAFWEL